MDHIHVVKDVSVFFFVDICAVVNVMDRRNAGHVKTRVKMYASIQGAQKNARSR